MSPKLPNPWYLTPSKASKLADNDFSFLQTYFIGNKKETSDAMLKGVLVHEIFYELMRVGNDIEKSNLVKEPEKWPTKKESGVTQDIYKFRWHEKMAKENKIVYKDNLKPVIDAIRIAIECNDIFQEYRKQKTAFEVILEDHKYQLAGILDIKSFLRSSDIKTTSKEFHNEDEFIKWSEKSFAVQQIHYERLMKANDIKPKEDFLFHVIQLCWPYQVVNIKLDPKYVNEVRQWFNLDVFKRWKELWKKLESSFGKYPFKKPENIEQAIDLWKKANKKGIYSFSKIGVATPSNYFMNQIRKDINRLETEAFEKYQEEHKAKAEKEKKDKNKA